MEHVDRRTDPNRHLACARRSSTAPARSPRSKLLAALLACWLGWMGAHWWYLRRRGAWAVTLYAAACLAATRFYPVWYDNPAFFLLFIPMVDGFIESVVISLRSDAKFDARHNPHATRPTRTGWGPVLVALGATLVGAVCTLFGIAMVTLYVWRAAGWLDGYAL